MTDLFWPGDHRAGDVDERWRVFDGDARSREALGWVGLSSRGMAPAAARADLTDQLCRRRRRGDRRRCRGRRQPGDRPGRAAAATAQRSQTARWLHRGLTSQDVIDTALMLCVRDVLARIGNELASQVRTLSGLAETHRDTPMVARTLTQAALPSTVGVKMAHWLSGVYRSRRAGGGAAGLAARAGRRRGGNAGRQPPN